VIDLDARHDRVVVGRRGELDAGGVVVDGFGLYCETVSPTESLLIQLRYRGEPIPCRLVKRQGSKARFEFDGAFARGAPGQAAVLYREDLVIGGGVIASSAFDSSIPLHP